MSSRGGDSDPPPSSRYSSGRLPVTSAHDDGSDSSVRWSSAPPSSQRRPRRSTGRSSLPPRFEPWNNPEMLVHAELFLESYAKHLGKELILPGPLVVRARALWEAPFVVASHGTEPDPLFNYGNRTALKLWEFEWGEFVGMPSRYSAQDPDRDERDRLLRSVERQGYHTGYTGVRGTKNGRRFRIEDVTVFNLVDSSGKHRGQGATYAKWTFLKG